MAFRRYVIAILVFVIFVAAAFTMMIVADLSEDSAAQVADNVTNESINQQVDLWQFVNKAIEDDTAGFNESVTVYNSSDVELEEGVDYEWNATDGTIKYHNTAKVNDGETGNISYTYFRNTQEVSELSKVIDPIVAFVSRSGLFVGGLGLVVVFLAFGSLVARYLGGQDFQSNR